MRFPRLAPMNQIPIICPTSFFGESLVMLEVRWGSGRVHRWCGGSRSPPATWG